MNSRNAYDTLSPHRDILFLHHRRKSSSRTAACRMGSKTANVLYEGLQSAGENRFWNDAARGETQHEKCLLAWEGGLATRFCRRGYNPAHTDSGLCVSSATCDKSGCEGRLRRGRIKITTTSTIEFCDCTILICYT